MLIFFGTWLCYLGHAYINLDMLIQNYFGHGHIILDMLILFWTCLYYFGHAYIILDVLILFGTWLCYFVIFLNIWHYVEAWTDLIFSMYMPIWTTLSSRTLLSLVTVKGHLRSAGVKFEQEAYCLELYLRYCLFRIQV